MGISADDATTFVGAIVSASILGGSAVFVGWFQDRRRKAPLKSRKRDAWQQQAQQLIEIMRVEHSTEVEHYRGQIVALNDTIQTLLRERPR